MISEPWAVDGDVVVLDGATGTQVEDEGVDVRCALWGSVALLDERGREVVTAIHRRYIEAGADIVTANTHNASLAYCGRYLRQTAPADRPPEARAVDAETLMRQLNETALAVARRAAEGTQTLVAGCLASPDLPYTRTATLTPEEVEIACRPQLDVLIGSVHRPDLVLFEMCTTSSDLEGVTRLARGLSLPVGVGVVCGEDGRTLGGVEMAEVVRAVAPSGPSILFVQCTPWDQIEQPLVDLARAARPLGIAVGAYGNDGRSWGENGWQGTRVSPEAYAAAATRWTRLGARVVGGCCGTTPEHVRVLRERLSG